MSTCLITSTILIILLATAAAASHEQEVVKVARAMVSKARTWVRTAITSHELMALDPSSNSHISLLVDECDKLYDESEARLTSLVELSEDNYTADDARTWLSGVLASHGTCLDGLSEKGFVWPIHASMASNLTSMLGDALALYVKGRGPIRRGPRRRPRLHQNGGLLTIWNPSTSKADFVVAKDGSGTHRTINEALAAVSKMSRRPSQRVIVYVKSGVYNEKVEIDRNMKNIMFVGDGMDRTIVSGRRNVPDGATTYGSATFGVSGDGFWARDMTFENIAGPHKHQAVALRASSDMSIFYRCSFKGYQDTLFVHSLRQFYRDCHIYGTIDFIFGDASAVLQNCDIFVKRPMNHQANTITAQGRDNPYSDTGISIQASRVRPAPEFEPVKGSFKTYLGRPWKKYSRTVFLRTDLDGFIDPKGWTEWDGSFALSTLFYAEYMNTGPGASTANRVRWPGFHVLRGPQEARPFIVSTFIQGESWIPASGVPFLSAI